MDTVSCYILLNNGSDYYGTSLHIVCDKILVMEILTNLEKSMAFTKFSSSKNSSV